MTAPPEARDLDVIIEAHELSKSFEKEVGRTDAVPARHACRPQPNGGPRPGCRSRHARTART